MEYTITVSYRDLTEPLNGLAAEEKWLGCERVPLTMFDGSQVPEYWKTQVQAFWTRNALYIRFEGCYDQLRTAPAEIKPEAHTGKTYLLWDLSDVYEVFVGPESKKNGVYKEFQVSPDSRYIDIAIDASAINRISDFNWISDMEALSVVDQNQCSWIGLFKLPFTAFGQIPDENTVWNINFYRIGGQPENQFFMAWAPVYKIAFHQPDKFGRIVFLP